MSNVLSSRCSEADAAIPVEKGVAPLPIVNRHPSDIDRPIENRRATRMKELLGVLRTYFAVPGGMFPSLYLGSWQSAVLGLAISAIVILYAKYEAPPPSYIEPKFRPGPMNLKMFRLAVLGGCVVCLSAEAFMLWIAAFPPLAPYRPIDWYLIGLTIGATILLLARSRQSIDDHNRWLAKMSLPRDRN